MGEEGSDILEEDVEIGGEQSGSWLGRRGAEGLDELGMGETRPPSIRS
jgi:hypothetical protein